MSEVWVLIWIVGRWENIHTGSQEFSTEEKCKAAAEAMKKNKISRLSVHTICVRK